LILTLLNTGAAVAGIWSGSSHLQIKDYMQYKTTKLCIIFL